MMDVAPTPTGGGCFGIIIFILLSLFGASFFLVQGSGEVAPPPDTAILEPAIVTAVAPPIDTTPPPAEDIPFATPEVYYAITTITCGDQLSGEVAGPSALVTGLFATRDIEADTIFGIADVSDTAPVCP